MANEKPLDAHPVPKPRANPTPQQVASARKLKASLDAIPGATDAFLNALRDPELPKQVAAGAAKLIEICKTRAGEVGLLVAIAEVEDPIARMSIAVALQRVLTKFGPKKERTTP